jgi:peptidoglycan/LPS O-acetylase OafA/YrhL
MGVFRLLLALSVMTGHMGKSILGFHQLSPDVAVQCFYIISGFYMALILTEKYNRPGDYGIFIRQRFLRIYPTYAIIVALIMLVEATVRNSASFNCWDGWIKYGPHLTLLTGTLMVLTNLLIIGQDWLLFFAVNPHTGALYFTPNFRTEDIPCYVFLFCRPSWSLGVELVFYAMAPFLVRQRLKLQVAVLLASVAVRVALQMGFHLSDDPWSYRFFPSQLAYFMVGSLGYQAYRCYGPHLAAFLTSKRWLIWVFWLSMFTYGRLPGSSEVRADCFLLATTIMVPLLFSTFCNSSWDRAVGELSYPLYLMHFLVLYLLDPIWHTPFYSISCLALGICSAYLFYHFIESRLDLYRATLFRRQRQEESGILTPLPASPNQGVP